MKTILSLLGGAVVLTEQGGKFTLSLDGSLGGGAAAGILVGQASLVVDAASGLKLAQALLNSHLPAVLQAPAAIVEDVADQALEALE
jgi:hypothetical protein